MSVSETNYFVRRARNGSKMENGMKKDPFAEHLRERFTNLILFCKFGNFREGFIFAKCEVS